MKINRSEKRFVKSTSKTPIKFIFLPLLFLLSFPLFSLERIADNAGLLNPDEKKHLADFISSIAEEYNFDLVIVTEKSISNKHPMNYADDYFDYNGYGLGDDRDGCLFLLVTGSRDYWFSTSGRGIGILNNSAFGKLSSDVVKYLKDDQYYAAINTFLKNWEKFLVMDASNNRYNFFYRWNIHLVIGGWLIAFGIGCIIVLVWKKGMNTVRPQTQAAAYVIPGSLAYNQKKDSFLYSVVSKTKRQSSSSSSGGSHTSSSGRSHGGGGGKY